MSERNLTKLINSALSELGSLNQETKDYLISLAEDGSLKQHQTRGYIELWAAELLKKLLEGGRQDKAQ